MNHLDFILDTKAVDGGGTIEGIAAGYGDVDHGGDRIMPGALTKSLVGRSKLPMLLFHDQKRPVGVWNELREEADGLYVKGKFAMSTTAGKDAHAMASEGALPGLSIGYIPIRHKSAGRVRELHELAAHEVSLVTVPMHQRAVVTSVKTILEAGDLPTLPNFEDFLCEAGGFSRTQAKAIAGKGLKHLLSQREAGREVDTGAGFLTALLTKAG